MCFHTPCNLQVLPHLTITFTSAPNAKAILNRVSAETLLLAVPGLEGIEVFFFFFFFSIKDSVRGQ